ncbi:GNAT family N-acetyltransferase [Pontixanthobacter aquaemixtae]|uniref:GNAT family N-acetyltransferase n=1 Tax=Pontixanthobacter aquaemixtae TaxID=1958940 RepID=A0A844ZS50_9SPHN|nr:GNAT family N-acetyltransferase [Pontixanthobacter aquaemixtae]MXO90693.1 GNAT family N-acetyltransferase [Pontixanthobacter aquaemixtae]
MTDDIDKIMDVMDAAFDPQWGEAWNRRQLTDSLAMPHTHYQLIGADGRIPTESSPAAGFTLTKAAPGEEELLLVAVRPEFRGTGLGKKLLQIFTDKARERKADTVFLEMRANNPAETLYRSVGFEPVGRRENYYLMADGNRIDAITFRLTL